MNSIINPLNKQKYLLHSKKGQQLLKKYIKTFMSGGYNDCIKEDNDFFLKESGSYVYDVTLDEDFSVSDPLNSDYYPEEINCNNKKYLYNGNLGHGTYGRIMLYNEENNPENKIALKIEKSFVKTEENIGEYLSNHPECNTIRVRYLTSYNDTANNYNLYILDKLNGDLFNFIDTYINEGKYNEWFTDVVEEVRKQIICLYKGNYYYTDLKLGNVLYCDSNGVISIHLGDLGSVTPDSDGDNIATHPPIEFKDSNGYIHIRNKEEAKQILTWLLGVLGLYVIDKNFTMVNLNFRFISQLDPRNIEIKIINSDLNEANKTILRKLLILDPRRRINEEMGGIDIEKSFIVEESEPEMVTPPIPVTSVEEEVSLFKDPRSPSRVRTPMQ